jgi:hypothetical protein
MRKVGLFFPFAPLFHAPSDPHDRIPTASRTPASRSSTRIGCWRWSRSRS